MPHGGRAGRFGRGKKKSQVRWEVYAIYLRGLADLLSHNGNESAAEFQKSWITGASF
jgi:hypothetical protein